MNDILVTGATGNVGRQVVDQLLDSGAAVRALVREPASAALPAGATVVGGDLSEPDGLVEALPGIGSAFLIWPFLTTEGAPAVLAALARHARRIVYLSSSGVDDHAARQTDPINQLHADMERLVKASGVEWSVLRSDTIASNTRGWAAQIRTTQAVRGPGIAATAVIHERDVAAVAARVLTEPGHAAATYVLTGPEVLSRAEQVQLIGEAIGRPLRFEELPLQVAREQMLADGRPPALVEALLDSAVARPASDAVTATVQEITGAPARTFRSWAREHADEFL
ncbi:NAD(P)H-binding protein [Streptomyces sp. NPDC089919]|uniref:NAD(P)H-binding protein n=1 Tax=Streptomyces sp. NPDC089919 TaxID=3155188 RepID=UPI00343D3A74